jgi:hypothetical protein
MSPARAIAVAAIGAGLLGGWYIDSAPTAQAPRQGAGYWILAADFHVHGFAGDGMLAPWALRREAQRQGLDVFALTNHNQTFTARFARWLAGDAPGPIVLVGQEVTARDFHISAVGIERTVDADRPAAAVIADVHAQGGAAIANHPESVTYTAGYDAEALAQLDGFERAHPIIPRAPGRHSAVRRFRAPGRRGEPWSCVHRLVGFSRRRQAGPLPHLRAGPRAYRRGGDRGGARRTDRGGRRDRAAVWQS